MKINVTLGQGSKYRFDDSKLKAIENQIRKHYVTRVGILGTKTEREAKLEDETHAQYKKRVKKQKYVVTKAAPVTNAEIGLAMEKGVFSKNIVPRSWLEMPLVHRSEKLLGYANRLFDDISKENIEIQYKKIGIKAEAIIQEAFDTGGFGTWKKPEYRDGKPLIDTGQLRRSVTSQVVAV